MAGETLEHTDMLGVVLFGLLMGALHVLLGVDHLLALAVVSAPEETDAADAATDYADEERHLRRRDDDGDDGDGDDEDRRRRHGIKTSAITRRRVLRCFVLGIRWGAGHSIGLATVCAVFFATRRRLNLEALGVVTDKLLGASMIVLGALSLVSLHRWRKRRAAECAHIIDSSSAGVGDLELHVSIAHSESSSSVGVGAGATGAGVAMPAKTAAWRAAGAAAATRVCRCCLRREAKSMRPRTTCTSRTSTPPMSHSTTPATLTRMPPRWQREDRGRLTAPRTCRFTSVPSTPPWSSAVERGDTMTGMETAYCSGVSA